MLAFPLNINDIWIEGNKKFLLSLNGMSLDTPKVIFNYCLEFHSHMHNLCFDKIHPWLPPIQLRLPHPVTTTFPSQEFHI